MYKEYTLNKANIDLIEFPQPNYLNGFLYHVSCVYVHVCVHVLYMHVSYITRALITDATRVSILSQIDNYLHAC